ncbi:hypothetical protein [Meridianimarinicoccus roseus]|jgi:hypothetical protein|nr:hypothetical protein [Meridianimarinicoccus roseus]
MTAFEVAIPLIALAVAATGVWLLRREAARIDARKRSSHPAE